MTAVDIFGNLGRILVVKAAGIGDLILSVPALRALRHRYPNALIDLLVTPKCADLFQNSPYVDAIQVIPTEGMTNQITRGRLLPLMRTLGRLRRNRYDMLINLYHLFSERGARRMKQLCRVIGPRYAIGRNTDGRGGFYDAWILDSWDAPLLADRHEVDINLDVVRMLGAVDPGHGLEFWVTQADQIALEAILGSQEKAGGGALKIVLNPGADAVYKRWPVAYFAELGDLLVERFSAHLFVIGAEGQGAPAARLVAAMKRPAVDLCGKLNLLELAALLQQSDIMVTNDTGPMHLAAAVGTPVIALFGPGKPSRYGPYGPPGFHLSVQGRAPCSPCTRFDCTSRTCMNDISPRQVLEKIEVRLASMLEPSL